MQNDPYYVKEIKTELVDLIKDLSSLKRNYYYLYDGFPDLLRTINTEGIILDCNKVYAQHLGYTKKELIGTSIFDTTTEESLDAMRNSFESWKSTGVVRNREVWFKRKDGTKFLGLISATSLYDDDGKIIGSNTVIKDITEIYETRKKLEESKENNLEKDKFINMITGELKSSANQITNFLKNLSSQNLAALDTSLLAKLDEIKDRAKSMAKILSDTYDMRKIENSELILYKSQNNLSKIIENVILKVREEIGSHGCSIDTELLENVSLAFDKNRIEQVLVQVITNAISFSPKVGGKVHVKLDYQNEYARITFTDNGIGIQPDKLDKIFEKFHSIQSGILREHGGAGLGLFICRAIVEGHSGRIWAESKGTGTGAQIHILLPLFTKSSSEIRKIE